MSDDCAESLATAAEDLVGQLELPGQSVNIAQVFDALVDATGRVANSITATGIPGQDASGGTVASLTEAVMGVTAGLMEIAAAIRELAQALPAATPPRSTP